MTDPALQALLAPDPSVLRLSVKFPGARLYDMVASVMSF